MSYDIKCDVHTHTLYSRHAYSTLEENVAAACARKLTLLGSTDHFSSMLFSDPESLKNYQFFTNQGKWPRVWKKVCLLRGCEADIVDLEGHLFGEGLLIDRSTVGDVLDPPIELGKYITGRLDYVIASIHGTSHTIGAGILQTTQMYIKALEHREVLFLGHPGRAGVAFDTDEVLKAAKEMHKMIEINEHSFDSEGDVYQKCRSIAVRCAELGTQIIVSSDAHISCDIGIFTRVTAMLREIGFPEQLIANRSAESFLLALQESGV